MKLGNILTVRFFVIASLLLSGFILNGVMLMREEVAQPRTVQQYQRVVSRLKRLRYTPSSRTKNINQIGAGSGITRSVLNRIERYEKLYRVSNPHPLVVRGLKESGSRTQAATRFCRQAPRKMDPAYGAVPLLVKLTDEGELDVLKITDLASGITVVNPLLDERIQLNYAKMEESDFGGRPDKPCVAISLMLLGTDQQITLSEYEDNPKDSMMPPTCEFLLEKYDGLENKLITYLANFHYVAELAQDPKNGICDQ